MMIAETATERSATTAQYCILRKSNGQIAATVRLGASVNPHQLPINGEDFECAWADYFKENGGGWWHSRTPESEAAWRGGVPAFFAYLLGSESEQVPSLPPGTGSADVVELHWI